MLLLLLLNRQLLRDKHVTFAGYIRQHPLENDIFVKIQTSSNCFTPEKAFKKACQSIQHEAKVLSKVFEQELFDTRIKRYCFDEARTASLNNHLE